MKKQTRTRLQKAMALVLSAIIVLSAFAVMPADLFIKAGAAEGSTVEDRYDDVTSQIDNLASNIGSTAMVDYYLYSATPNGIEASDEEAILPDGEYAVTGTNGSVMTHGLQATGTVTGTSDTWFFERQTSGKYYVYYNDDNGTKQYLNINGSTPTITITAQELAVRATLDGVVTIGDGNGNYLYYSDGVVGINTEATNLTFYNVDVKLEQHTGDFVSGTYVIAHTSGLTLQTAELSGSHLLFKGTPSVGSETWTVTVNGNNCTIQSNSSGQFLQLNGSGFPGLGSSEAIAYEWSNGVLKLYESVTSGCDTSKYYFKIDTGSSEASASSSPGGDADLNIYKLVGKISKYVPTPTGYDTVPPIEDGGYVVYHNGVIMGRDAVVADVTGVNGKAVTVSNDTINTLVVDQYYFEHIEGSLYNVSVATQVGNDGSAVYQHLHFNGEEGYLAFAPQEEAVIVYANPDGTVQIFDQDSSQKISHGDIFSSSGENSVGSPDSNESLTLYRNPSAVKGMVDKTELYNELKAAIAYAPDNYTEASYNKFLQTLEDSLATYNDGKVTDKSTVTKAVYNIRNAIVNLEELDDEPDYRSFPATLYKFGYNPSATTANAKYSAGGAAFNAQTYAEMEDIIRADENLMGQIKEAIGYTTRPWNAGQADAALNTAITTYAKIYSLAFTGNTLSSNGTNITDFQNTAWNVWTKTETGSDNGGASVQGIFSSMLNDGNPTNHAPYDTLAYGNVASSGSYNSANGIEIEITVGTTKYPVTLPALEGISVHVNDIFTRENVLVDGSTTNYSKYYWDFDFPFVETIENGVSTYSYSSSDSSYLFQASFNDAEHTAEAQLTEGSGGTGFFPFNNQLTGTSPAGSAYHFGMTFSTEFYIPASGEYSDGNEVEFTFSGDDDVLVYIDDVLVLDNGGLHAARKASINFTQRSISYQYAMNLGSENATVEKDPEKQDGSVTYKYDGDKAGLTGDELAALEKLNEVRTDGEYHTLTFYYLERGSNESNCEIKFNIQQVSNHVLLNDETLVVDYGLPVEYDIKKNDKVDEIDGLSYHYEGIVEANNEVASVVTFNAPTDLVSTFVSENDVLNVQGLNYGTATMSGDGLVTYTPNTMNMTGRDYFYSCAEIVGDPTYNQNYYQYERAVFIPATTIYYEDNFGADISFKDGSGNAKWTTDGDVNAFADAKQAADLAGDVMANPYGYDPIYAGNNAGDNKDYTKYSGFSAHKVTVSKNLATNPTVEFTFTGTGFDIISLTDSTTGAFYVDIFDTNNKQVGKKMVVDTYYGSSYGQLYADADGKATLTETDTPLYRSAVNEAIAKEPTYFAVDGMGYTETPTYYDANGNLTETETENPAYAYAYGWVTTDNAEGLYQIPVIKKTDLAYGTYKVVITPMYSRLFDNTGKGQFDVYIDAIRIYNPAGKDDNIESSILTDYKYDNESYPNYLTIKDIIIGADSLSKDSATQGVVFIDGIAALDNDLEKYKLAGPNNELYLARDPDTETKRQAVAFEIWATAIPDEVQLGVKSVKGKPTLGITYNGNTVKQTINTATEMNYIINNLLPEDGKLEWKEKVVNGETYYRTDTIVIQNLSDDASILSLTNMKWTFTGVGQHGHYETQDAEPVMMFMSRRTTVSDAYAMMSNDNVPNDGETDNNAGSEIIPGDNNNTNDTNDENQGVLTFIQRIIEAITNFFKKIFGLA